MKSIGIVRKIDNVGRIVVPMETRKLLGIAIGDPVEMYVEGDVICLRKYDPPEEDELIALVSNATPEQVAQIYSVFGL